MPTEIGQALREARVRRGIELSDVEHVTKIRIKYLRAMEEDRWGLLPGTAYARGFLATYARFLDLDETALVEEYRGHERVDEVGPIPTEMLPKRGVVRRPRIPPGAAIVAGLVAAVVLGVAIVGLPGDSGNGGDGAARETSPEPRGASPPTTSATEPTAAQPAPVSLRLRSIATVWVCVLGDRGRALVNGETLMADEARGPFETGAFKARSATAT